LANGKIELEMVENGAGTAYVSLPGHPPQDEAPGCVKKTVVVSTLIPGYKGPLVVLDFDSSDTLIGIELIDD
jgi:hypothetical protein